MTLLRYKAGVAALALAPFIAMKAIAAPIEPVAVNVDPDVTDPSLIVFDQQAGSNAVTFSYVYLPHDGYVAVYGSDGEGNAATDEVLGYVPLESGDHRNITVEIDQELESGQTFWASLYRDDDGDKKLDKSEDSAFWPEGKPFENKFNVL